MEKRNKESGKGETPLVRTLYDRRKHEQLVVDDGGTTKRILVQPAKNPRHRPLADDIEVQIYDAATDSRGVGPVKPPRKFVPMTPKLPERSFARKWQMVGVNETPSDDEALTIPVATVKESVAIFSPAPIARDEGGTGNKKEGVPEGSPPGHTSTRTRSTSSSSSSSESEESVAPPPDPDSSSESEELPLPADYYESTPVLPFSTWQDEDQDVHACGSSPGTSIELSKTDEAGDADESEDGDSELRRDHESILKLFKVGDQALNVKGMNMTCSKYSVEDFYSLKDVNAPELPLVCRFHKVMKNLKGFAKTPVAIGAELHCHISRDKRGISNNLYPLYYMYMEVEGDRSHRILILAARKRKRSTTSYYVISTDPAQLRSSAPSYVGKVRANLIGTEFTIFDDGNSPMHFKHTARGIDLFNYREELGAVIYESNILGLNGPRKMKLMLPSMLSESKRFECRPDVVEETILELSKKRQLSPTLLELRNKDPKRNRGSHSFGLNFGGRVTIPSVRNFQIIHKDKPEYVILQFGRVDDDNFTLDFAYPLCPLQALGIALTSLDNKIACE